MSLEVNPFVLFRDVKGRVVELGAVGGGRVGSFRGFTLPPCATGG